MLASSASVEPLDPDLARALMDAAVGLVHDLRDAGAASRRQQPFQPIGQQLERVNHHDRCNANDRNEADPPPARSGDSRRSARHEEKHEPDADARSDDGFLHDRSGHCDRPCRFARPQLHRAARGRFFIYAVASVTRICRARYSRSYFQRVNAAS